MAAHCMSMKFSILLLQSLLEEVLLFFQWARTHIPDDVSMYSLIDLGRAGGGYNCFYNVCTAEEVGHVIDLLSNAHS